MRTIGILAGSALLALTTGVQAQAPVSVPAPAVVAPSASVPPAGAYYGPGAAAAAPAANPWYGAPTADRGRHAGRADRRDYHSYERGARMGGIWRDPAYAVNDWQAWGLGQPGPGMHWLRYYDDAILVDAYGTVVDARHGLDWDGPRRGPMQGYAGGPGYPGPGYGAPGWQGGPGTTITRVGPNTTVTTQVIGGGAYGGAGYGGGYAVGAGTLIITPGSVVTTTTTTSEETVYKNVYRKRVYRRPVRHYRPRCVQAPTCPVQGS